MNCGNTTGVAFLDFRKALDTVNHDILIRKLHELGVSYSALKWFKSYLSCRSQKVCFKDCLSESLKISAGVPQGSILGSLFFIVIINSMNKAISYGKISMYADDTTLSISVNNVEEISTR